MENIKPLYGPPRSQEKRKFDRLYTCEACGKNHPTPQCLTRPNMPMAYQSKGKFQLWCDFDKKWGNHMMDDRYNCIYYMRGQAMEGLPNIA